MDFGNKLKELRNKAGLTQQQLAKQLGVTKSVISFYERRERMPSPEILKKLAAVFHVSTDFLLDIDKVNRIDASGLDEDDVKIVSLMIETLRKKNNK